MNNQQQLIETFYTAFNRLDHAAMNACYSTDIVFNDPVFGVLKGDEVRAMWEMLCGAARDFSVTYGPIELLDEEYATCQWTATYTFSRTGRKVVNKVKAYMKFSDGKIVEHSDAFRLSTWIGQALGWKGQLFGWTGFMKRAVQKQARKGLERYMQGKDLKI